MAVEEYLHTLAEVNRNGFAFLLAYGTTWLLAALAWWRLGERPRAYVALFQGMVALPAALALTALTATGPRPEDPTLGALSFYLSMGQLVVLPVAVVLVMHRRHLAMVTLLAVVLAAHFIPYSWLYQTPVYVGVGALVALGVTAVLALEARVRAPGAAICAVTGGVLLLGSGAAVLS